VDLTFAPDVGYHIALHRDGTGGTDPGNDFQGPLPAPAGAPAYVFREEQSAAAVAYGQGQRVFVAWAAPDESRWWVLAVDPATGRVARLRQWSADPDGEPVDEGLLEVADYDAAGSGPPARLRELHAGRLVAELALEPVETPEDHRPPTTDRRMPADQLALAPVESPEDHRPPTTDRRTPADQLTLEPVETPEDHRPPTTDRRTPADQRF
jgi:hypothetical protein